MRVSSSNISDIDYDEESRVLSVTFNTGSQYEYSGVPQYVWEQLKSAGQGGGSVGQTFNSLVKRAGYQYTQVG